MRKGSKPAIVVVVALALAMLLCLAGCGASQQSSSGQGTLRVGVRDDIMNFSYLNEQTGKYYGLEIDIAEEMAKRLGYADVEYVAVTPDDRKERLLNGEMDCLIACYSISDTRLENFDFSPAYYHDVARIMVENSSLITDPWQLQGKTIGIMSGSNTGPVLAIKLNEVGIIGDDVVSNDDAGTQYQGAYIKKVASYAELSQELEEGAVDAANIIKPALGRGEIQIIGATTLNEYRKYIEKDAALERRFQPVTVGEPSQEATLEILKGLREKYEQHHKLHITDEALKAAVELSTRYINDRFLPDKAIDLMDEAASRVRMEQEEPSEELKSLEEKINALSKDKDAAINAQDFEKAAQLRDIEKDYKEQVEIERDKRRKNDQEHRDVNAEDIAAVVSGWTGIPVTRLTEDEGQRLLHMEDILHKRVVGQDEAVKAVARAIRRGRVGLKDPKRPIGSFLFLGPTGVGKTELCKSLAEAMFGDENAMIRIDMSEYMERHTVSRLIGSPPGYVGHDEGGQLTEKVRRKPYSVVLFDEIEKAHEDVWNIMLQILDDGRITDSQGRTVDFKNTVIVMTSNIGAKALTAAGAKLGFDADDKKAEADADAAYAQAKETVLAELRQTFRPEFLNRIDDIIVFRALTEQDIEEVARRMLKTVADRMETMDIHLDASDEAVKELAKEGFDPKYGARPLRRAIQSKVEDAVAEKMLDGTLKTGDTAKLAVEDDKLVVTK